MTREEAITALGDRNNLLWGMSKEEKKYYSEALDMAISALSAEPCDDSDALLMKAIRESLAMGGIHGADATVAMVQVLKTIWRFDLIPPCCRDEVKNETDN